MATFQLGTEKLWKTRAENYVYDIHRKPKQATLNEFELSKYLVTSDYRLYYRENNMNINQYITYMNLWNRSCSEQEVNVVYTLVEGCYVAVMYELEFKFKTGRLFPNDEQHVKGRSGRMTVLTLLKVQQDKFVHETRLADCLRRLMGLPFSNITIDTLYQQQPYNYSRDLAQYTGQRHTQNIFMLSLTTSGHEDQLNELCHPDCTVDIEGNRTINVNQFISRAKIFNNNSRQNGQTIPVTNMFTADIGYLHFLTNPIFKQNTFAGTNYSNMSCLRCVMHWSIFFTFRDRKITKIIMRTDCPQALIRVTQQPTVSAVTGVKLKVIHPQHVQESVEEMMTHIGLR
jgi:hypothetical protein